MLLTTREEISIVVVNIRIIFKIMKEKLNMTALYVIVKFTYLIKITALLHVSLALKNCMILVGKKEYVFSILVHVMNVAMVTNVINGMDRKIMMVQFLTFKMILV